MSPRQLRLALLSVLVLAIFGFFAVLFLGLSNLSEKSNQLVELKLKNKNLEDQLTALAQAKKDVDKYSYFNDVAKTVLPTDKDQAQAVVNINEMADQAGIGISSITFPASTLGAPRAQVSASGAKAATAISQAKPVEGISGLYSLELTITPMNGPGVDGSKRITYAKLIDFLRRIERNRRTAQINTVGIQPQAGGNSYNFTLTINIFLRP